MKISYEFSEHENESDISVVLNGLRDFNKPFLGGEAIFFAVYAKSSDGEIVGGALTYSAGSHMLLDNLWVNDKCRTKGVGKTIIEHLAKEAKSKGINTIFTDTYSFQAEDFYIKQGFEVHGQVSDCLGGFSKIFLKKIL